MFDKQNARIARAVACGVVREMLRNAQLSDEASHTSSVAWAASRLRLAHRLTALACSGRDIQGCIQLPIKLLKLPKV